MIGRHLLNLSVLRETNRNQLVQIVTDYFMSQGTNLDSRLLQTTAKQICQIFKNEQPDAYYIPHQQKPLRKASGKLIARKYNINKKTKFVVANKPCETVAIPPCEVDLTLLKAKTEVCEVLENWHMSTEARYQEAQEYPSLKLFFDEYPVLRSKDSFKLVKLY